MKLDKRDMWFVGVVVVVLGIFIAISGKEKTKIVPYNADHRVAYEAAYKKAPAADASIFKRAFFKPDKKAAEVFCEPCHQERGIKFPPNHPPKNRCLLCHKLKLPRG
jgi:hypothetical protein